MITRLVEVRTKGGKAQEFSRTVGEIIVPLLKNQPGFVDLVTLMSTTDPDRIVALSFWQSEPDAERYNREGFSTVVYILKPLLESAPRAETFKVCTSTVYRIAEKKTA